MGGISATRRSRTGRAPNNTAKVARPRAVFLLSNLSLIGRARPTASRKAGTAARPRKAISWALKPQK